MYEERFLQQNLGFVRPKYIVLDGLRKKTEELGKIGASFDFSLEYPRHETMAQDSKTGQTVIRRRVVVKKVQSEPTLNGIGQTYANESYTPMPEEVEGLLEAQGVGQVDTHTIEVSVWSPDSKDRDMLIDLIKIWMLELNRNAGESGVPFFYERGIYAVEEVRNYETIDRGNANTPFHVGIIVYRLLCPFYAIHTDRFSKFKFDLINKIIDNTPDDGLVVVIPDPNTTTPPTGGGGGSGGGSSGGGQGNSDTIVVPKYEDATQPHNIGGNYSHKGDETLIIPGPNTEERTVQSVVSKTEE